MPQRGLRLGVTPTPTKAYARRHVIPPVPLAVAPHGVRSQALAAVSAPAFEPSWLRAVGPDLLALGLSLLLVAAYYGYLRARLRRDPSYSIHYVNDTARRLWVQSVMANPAKDVMAVQTLRNFIMIGILMVSTATLLVIGTLTLTGQVENMSRSWHSTNLFGPASAQVWSFKVLCLLADFIVAFFAFTLSLRLANHVLFMINVPAELRGAVDALSPEAVARRLNRAAYMISIGIRALFAAVPLVFWLFGPIFLVVGTLGLLIALFRLDRNQMIV